MTQDAFHVAIIMDGNGRWAVARSLSRLNGHSRGVERVKELVKYAPDRGITHLTLFAFSTENWRRSKLEVEGLMELLKRFILSESTSLFENDIRVEFIGRRDRLAPSVVKMIEGLEERTRNCSRLHLTIALDYGGRDELVRATKSLVMEALAGNIVSDEINEDMLCSYLDTSSLPDPDLIIRTSGEKRTSNFLPFQGAYSEYEFVPEAWPDFTSEVMDRAICDFKARDRRFGAVQKS